MPHQVLDKRNRKALRHSVVPVDVLNAVEISFGAKGFYTYLCSLPNGYDLKPEIEAEKFEISVKEISYYFAELMVSGLLTKDGDDYILNDEMTQN